ncbi:MAG: tetratricopeptide repeat protein [Acidobacteria bacterium]|nr:tetratricopeptide repeat protein [Acidobacteriota bacterium]
MKHLSLTIVLTLAAVAVAQTPTPPVPGQPAPTGRPPIRAKTQEEYQAYQAAVSSQTPEAMEKAANDFSTKFANSDLRVLLYRAVMQSYQKAGDSDGMLNAGLKILSIDKDDPEALIGVAEVQEEHTSVTDLDRAQRMDEAVANAQHALTTIDSDLTIPSGVPTDKVEAYKRYLRATALAIVGTIQYKREQYPEAEATLRKAIDADSSTPDAVVILRLALALDQEKKYPEALQQAQRAVELTQEATDVGKMARTERDRLLVQTGGNPPANTQPPTSSPQNPAAPPH